MRASKAVLRTARRSASGGDLPRRPASGQMIIVLGAVIALVIIPMIGLFVFELNRYQFAQQALAKACDAAALAGGAKLISAEVNAAAGDAQARRTQKQKQAIAAAINFMRKQRILGVDLANLQDNSPNQLTSSGMGPNECRVTAYPADPGSNYSPVALGSENGTAIRIDAVFTEVPSFVKHVGINQVPVFATASSGAPRLEIVLCLDMSGSMDDSTRISLVRKQLRTTAAGEADFADNPPPPEPAYASKVEEVCGAEPPEVTDPNAPGYQEWQDWSDCKSQFCATYNDQKNAYEQAYDATKNNPNNFYWDYLVIASGQLRAVFERNGVTFQPSGTQINALPHRHLQFTNQPYTPKNYPFRYNPGDVDNCNGGSGFTDIVVNLDSKVGAQPWPPEQPILTNNVFEPSSGPDPDGFSFVSIADLVEAARGTANANDAWGAYKNSTQTQWSVGFGGDNKRQAYEKDAKYYVQPAATVIDAAKAFIDALADSGRNIKMGVAGYDTQVVDYDTLPDDPNAADNQFERADVVKVNEEGVERLIPLVDLYPLSNPAYVEFLKGRLDLMYSLRTTNMNSALLQAKKMLDRPNAPARGVKRLIVLFSDGQFTEDPPFATASDCGTKKIAINTIGLAQNADLQSSMMNTLTSITNNAGNGGIFLSAPSAQEVKKAFLMLARRLVKLQQ